MTFRFHPRAHSAVLVSPLLLCIVALYVSSDYVAGDLDGYWTAATAKAASALIFIAPVTAACAAWEAGRLRRARIGEGTPARSGWQIAAVSLTPVVLMGFCALAMALAVARLHMESASGWPDGRIIGASCVVVCAHTVVGYAVGLRLPAVAAVPVVLVGDYLWNVYPPALEPLWLRHLTQPASGCCLSTVAVDLRGVAAPALVAVGLAALATAAAALSRRTPRLGHLPTSAPYLAGALAAIVAFTTTSVGVSLVNGLGPDAVQARPTADLVCTKINRTRTCVWPEHASRLPEAAQTVSEAVERLRSVGVTPPEVVTESTQHPGKRQWTVTVRQDVDFTSQDIVAGLASDLTVNLTSTGHEDNATVCSEEPVTAVQEALDAEEELHIWLSVHAGMPQRNFGLNSDPRTWKPVEDVLKTSPGSQEAWYHSTLSRAWCMPR
ncbi:hypothetical protein [Streptomyces sp. SID8352]|uniref:DUF7224 domain-containing protein n=1 Tax=Streptomyces sp. SID8352 TaxID=2690338 RepID=UPI00136F6E60|nr:hypothetical protein [Streptomyces sp. SID8352]